jgi:hypothetical protein
MACGGGHGGQSGQNNGYRSNQGNEDNTKSAELTTPPNQQDSNGKSNVSVSEGLMSWRTGNMALRSEVEEEKDVWIADSGCDGHVTNNMKWYTDFVEFPTRRSQHGAYACFWDRNDHVAGITPRWKNRDGTSRCMVCPNIAIQHDEPK